MLLNHNDAKYMYISFIISSLHEVVKKFLFYNATSTHTRSHITYRYKCCH